MPQGQTYTRIKVRMPDGTERVFPAGTPIDVIKAETGAVSMPDLGGGGQTPSQPFGNLGPQVPTPKPGSLGSGREALSTFGKVLSLAGGLSPQTSAAKTLLGMLVSGLGGSISAGAEGDNPVMGAITESAMTGMGAGAGQLIPRAGLRAGMAIGGVKGDTKGAVNAFMRERGRPLPPGTPAKHRVMGRGVPLGARRRIDNRIENVSQQLENAEVASEATQPLGVLSSAGTKITDAARDTEFPLSLKDKVNENEIKFILEQLGERTGIPLGRLQQGRVSPLRPTVTSAEDAARMLPGEVPGGIEDLMWSTPVSVRDLGNFKRNQATKAKEVIRARMGGELIPDDVATAGQISANRAAQARTAQEEIAPEVIPINERLSDLFTMSETDDALRGGGGVLGDLGQMGMRGGLGAGMGGNIASVTGQNSLRALGGPLAMVGLSPSNISRLGYAGGRVAENIPTAIRGTDILNDLIERWAQDQNEDEAAQPDVPRLRRPGGG